MSVLVHTYPSLSQREFTPDAGPTVGSGLPTHHLRVYYLLIQSRGLPHQGSSSSFKTSPGPRTKMIFLGPVAKKWVYPVSRLTLR